MLQWFASEFNDDDNNTLFRDVALAGFAVMAAILVIIVFLINDPKEDAQEQARSRGNVRVEVIWPPNLNVDIDTWGKAPGDVPVGYSNLNGRVMNLVRDDLGSHHDLTGMNYEVMFSRGIPEGEWAFNLHWYSNSQGASEVPVQVLITLQKNDDGTGKSSPNKVLTKVVRLSAVKQELTIIRFRTDAQMNVIPDTFDTTFKPLRAWSPEDDD